MTDVNARSSGGLKTLYAACLRATVTIALALLFYVVVTPIGLLLRCFRWDPLRRRRDGDVKTYWLPRKGGGG